MCQAHIEPAKQAAVEAVAMRKRARRKHKRTLGEPGFDNFHEIDLNFNGSSSSLIAKLKIERKLN